MPFNLQSDLPDRALPDAIRSLLIQQTEALEALLLHAQDTVATLRARVHLSPQDKTSCLEALATEVTKRLAELEHKNVQIKQQIEEFQRMLSQQGNPILSYTLERVREVLDGNFAVAREQLGAMIRGQSP
jgi:hypothetical protein